MQRAVAINTFEECAYIYVYTVPSPLATLIRLIGLGRWGTGSIGTLWVQSLFFYFDYWPFIWRLYMFTEVIFVWFILNDDVVWWTLSSIVRKGRSIYTKTRTSKNEQNIFFPQYTNQTHKPHPKILSMCYKFLIFLKKKHSKIQSSNFWTKAYFVLTSTSLPVICAVWKNW